MPSRVPVLAPATVIGLILAGRVLKEFRVPLDQDDAFPRTSKAFQLRYRRVAIDSYVGGKWVSPDTAHYVLRTPAAARELAALSLGVW